MAIQKAITKYGAVVGVDMQDYSVFRAIPFAKPPVGELRFAPPEEPIPWIGERECSSFADAPLQYSRAASPKGAPSRHWMMPEPPVPATSEDCLYLNVWTPAKSEQEKLPVMVWIHGGGFNQSWSFKPIYDGSELCKKGVVVVTVAQRVSAMGYLTHKRLAGQNGCGPCGNWGLLDQNMALRWVQENINAFGGDSSRITIFGQSSGGMSVKFHLVSPLSRSLFSRAIVHSGGGLNAGDPMRTWQELASITEKAMEHLGWDFDDLMTLDGELVNQSICETAGKIMEKELFIYQPCMDGYFFPEMPEKLLYDGRISEADIICGTVNGDSWMFSRGVRDQLLSNQEALRAFSFSPQEAWARHFQRQGLPPIRSYFFERNQQGHGSPHSSELPYVFKTLDKRGYEYDEYDIELSEIMSSYWINFAKTGDPNGEGLPLWPYNTAEAPLSIHFTDSAVQTSRLCNDEEAERVIEYTIRHPGFLETLADF